MTKDDVTQLFITAFNKRQGLRAQTNAVRLVNGYGDGLEGLFLDQYNHHINIQILETSWYEHYPLILSLVQEYCGAEYVIVKDRTGTASSEAGKFPVLVLLENAASQTEVVENNCKYAVDLNDTLNTGLFLDMRANRALVAGLAWGRKVLNAFAYTCSFGVACRLQGASAVVNVDVGRKCLERGRHNYALNGLEPAANEFIRADVVEYLQKAAKKDNRFDLIILDPPSFARHDGRVFSVKKDLAPLVKAAMKVLNPKGLIFVATNYTEIAVETLEDMVYDSADERTVKPVRALGQDTDFVGSGLMIESYLAAVLAHLD